MQERRECVQPDHSELSIRRQCDLLSIHRSGFYYEPRKESELNLELMRLIDERYMKYSHMGVPSMTQWLRKDEGYEVNPKRIRRLYKLMGLKATVPGPHTSRAVKHHKKYPYLLNELEITHTNQVWATDITYIPMHKGFMYLMAVIDLHSRYVVGWSLSNSMSADWCTELVKDCIKRHEAPEIMNTDQGSQFTSEEFTGMLKDHEIRISMDSKGRAQDNIFIERLWRSVKYEQIYLKPAADGLELYQGLSEWFTYYNEERRHSSLDHEPPIKVFKAA
jgi:putative transposase